MGANDYVGSAPTRGRDARAVEQEVSDGAPPRMADATDVVWLSAVELARAGLVESDDVRVGVQMLGERINGWLARALDVTRLPMPLRLASLTAETGRILLSAVATLQINQTESRS